MPNSASSLDKQQLYAQLMQEARRAMTFSYSPYSKFAVGAAVLTEDGTIYTGCNIENINLTNGLCAERTAFAKAISEGKNRFKVVAVVAAQGKFCWPCGLCRQVMREFGGDTTVVVETGDGGFEEALLDELIPQSMKK
jgi:cytidine deaminase